MIWVYKNVSTIVVLVCHNCCIPMTVIYGLTIWKSERGRLLGFTAQCTNFKPTTEAMRVKIKNKRQNVVGSRKIKMPMSTVPTAPMPVHIG